MRKLLLALVVCVAMVGCKWYHETFDSVEDCTKWYLDQLYEAAADNDREKFDERFSDMGEWANGLSSSDQEKYMRACSSWGAANPAKIMKIDKFGFGGLITESVMDSYDYYY